MKQLPAGTPVFSKSTPANAGFTLIEIVFAITIFAMLLITAYGGIIGLLQIKKRVDEERELQQTALTLMDRLSREIQVASSTGISLLPPCDRQATSYGKNIFMLSKNSGSQGQDISFIAPGIGQMLPDGIQNTGNVQVTYHIEETGSRNNNQQGTLALVRDEIPLIRPVEKACKKMIRFTISDSIKTFNLRFYDQESEQWLNQWDENAKGLPKMVLVELELMTESGKTGQYSMMIGLSS